MRGFLRLRPSGRLDLEEIERREPVLLASERQRAAIAPPEPAVDRLAAGLADQPDDRRAGEEPVGERLEPRSRHLDAGRQPVADRELGACSRAAAVARLGGARSVRSPGGP